jgi:hypothetical protein
MISILSCILAVLKDVKEEIKADGLKYIFVSSDKALFDTLHKLRVNPSDVVFFDTKMSITDWSQVGGVFKCNGNVYAYSRDLNSELSANLSLISD